MTIATSKRFTKTNVCLFTFSNCSNYWKSQSGLSARMFNEILWTTKKMIGENSKIYYNLNSYIEDNSIFTNLRLSFLARYLVLMVLIDVVFVFLFLLHVLLTNLCRRFLRSKKRLKRNKN